MGQAFNKPITINLEKLLAVLEKLMKELPSEKSTGLTQINCKFDKADINVLKQMHGMDNRQKLNLMLSNNHLPIPVEEKTSKMLIAIVKKTVNRFIENRHIKGSPLICTLHQNDIEYFLFISENISTEFLSQIPDDDVDSALESVLKKIDDYPTLRKK